MPDNLKYIEVKKARVHNLKNVDVTIQRDSFVTVTGLSGSGKSSLAFNTIYAEGQRRYVESLSSYARQFLGRMKKPEVDIINGLPPAIAIEQKVRSQNPRSTVGTTTEIYDYLKLLYARIGRTFSPVSGEEVKKDTVTDVVNFILKQQEGARLYLLSPYSDKDHLEKKQIIEDLKYQGISRVICNGKVLKVKDLESENIDHACELNLVVDRIVVAYDNESKSRYADSVQLAYQLGHDKCIITNEELADNYSFSNIFERDGILFEEPTVHTFSFNNPIGACPRCEGYGKIIGIDTDLVVPDKSLSVYDDAVVCWKGEKMQEWKNQLVYNADKFDFPIHKPYFELSQEQKDLLWLGNRYFEGLDAFFNYLESNKYKIQYRVMLSRYRGKTICPKCKGTRLKPEASYVKINGYALNDLVDISADKLLELFKTFNFTNFEKEVAKRLIIEITNRLAYLNEVGLGYLTLNRLSSTLSGGESQRINLSTILGSTLVGSIYILDEPSIGLHSRDTDRLIGVLKKLQGSGNTILVVEHEEEIIRAADDIIDVGPGAGRFGGEIVFSGKYADLLKNKESLTAKYLTGEESIPVPERRKWNNAIIIKGAHENNLKNIDVSIPLNTICVITGVSGSGKSSLIKQILYPLLLRQINGYGESKVKISGFEGEKNLIQQVEFVDQNPIGRSSRSNPVTYLKAYDEIRKLYASLKLSKMNGFKPSHYSFNIDGGRCDECQGEGIIKVEMQFMSDIELVCEHCNGQRFKEEILEVKFYGKNIYDILELSVSEAIDFFTKHHSKITEKIVEKLRPLSDVGLDYVKLGQSSSTLSGGESQRVKLASFLAQEKAVPTMFLFDEPTTGLHFHDIKKLLASINALVERGHSVVIIEHNLEIIKTADWVIDLGPEGGDNGGYIVFEGTPEKLIKCPQSYTANYLKEKLFIK